MTFDQKYQDKNQGTTEAMVGESQSVPRIPSKFSQIIFTTLRLRPFFFDTLPLSGSLPSHETAIKNFLQTIFLV